MTNTLYKLSIIGVVLALLASCSYTGETQVAQQKDNPQSEELTKVKIPGALEVCRPEAGSPYYYRKAILVAGTISAPDLARDLPGLANLTSNRLQTHLDALERFNVSAAHNVSFESMALDTAARVSQFGRQYASQFVVKLELLDLTIHPSGGWFSELFEGSSTQRNVLIKLYIYDTEYGALFHSQQYQGTVSGDVVGYPGNGTTVTTSWFSTNLGTKIDEMLKAMSMQINEQLACVPFSTNVTAVIGDDIHISSGILQGIRPGNNLQLYHRIDTWSSNGSLKQEERGGRIRVKTVFPDHSIASLAKEEKTGRATAAMVTIGDVVRAW